MQLDSEDDFVPPAGVVASPTGEQSESLRPNTQDSEISDAITAAETTQEVEE